jgi:hypothetical protein
VRVLNLAYEIGCTPDHFWSMYFDEVFTRELFLEGLRWSDPIITKFRETDEEIIRHMGARPALEIGGKLARIIGDKLGYTEEGRFDRSTGEYHFRQVTSALGDRLDLRGKMWCEPRGDARCRWVSHVEIDVKMFGIARLIEKAVEINAGKGWATCARYFNQSLRRRRP